MPLVTIATCMLIMITWVNPGPVYAGEIQGVLWVDGSARFLTLEISPKGQATWIAPASPRDRTITDGHVVVMANPSAVKIGNLPYQIVCHRVYLPVIQKRETP